jgi:hypothetical protein
MNMYSITQDMANLTPFRLKSRKPIWKNEFLMQPFSISLFVNAVQKKKHPTHCGRMSPY